jgi:hypothetical protein
MRLRLTQPTMGHLVFWQSKCLWSCCIVDSTHFVQVIIDDWFVHVLSDEPVRDGRCTCVHDQYVSVLPDEYLSNIFDRFVHFDFTTMGLYVDDNNIVRTCITSYFTTSSKRFDMAEDFDLFLIWSALGGSSSGSMHVNFTLEQASSAWQSPFDQNQRLIWIRPRNPYMPLRNLRCTGFSCLTLFAPIQQL